MRDLTAQYLERRAQYRSTAAPVSPFPPSSPPAWVPIADQFRADFTSARSLLAQLIQLHEMRLKNVFNEETQKKQDSEISTIGGQLTALVKACENHVKRIAMVQANGNESGKGKGKRPTRMTQQERIMRTNCMRARAIELADLSKQFRQEQRRFLHTLREREAKASANSNSLNSAANQANTALANELMDRIEGGEDLNMSQQNELAMIEANATMREQKIFQLAKSINELASLFSQLNVLIIEQGTVLDRIDCNVETALEKVSSGTKTLDETDHKYGKGYATKCIGTMVTIIVVLFIILVIKSAS